MPETMLQGMVVVGVADVVIATIAARWPGTRLAPLLASALFLVPALAQQPLARLVLAVIALLTLFRVLDLAGDPRLQTFGAGLSHLLCLIVDSRLVSRRPPSLARTVVPRLVVAMLLAVLAAGVAYAAEEAEPWLRYACRWLGGVVLIFALVEGQVALLELIMAAAGVSAPRMHHAPHRSRSLGEFWSRRWNLGVARILHQRFFVPIARRGRGYALMATFGASAAGHAYGAGAALGPGAALAWATFFLVQPPLIAAERRLGVKRWPAAGSWAWKAAALLLFSPLFVEPAMRMFDELLGR